MKAIKIHINELGAVCDSTVEFKPLMIFSGESGLGKSYVAILVHYFYKLIAENRLQRFFDSLGFSYETLIASQPESGSFTIKASDLNEWINLDARSYMRQSVGNSDLPVDVSFEIPLSRDFYTFSYRMAQFGVKGKEKPVRLFILDDMSMRVEHDTQNIGSEAWSMLLREALNQDLFEQADIDQTFAMVPGRGALLNIPVTMQERVRGIGDIYSEFLTDWSVVRSMPARHSDIELRNLLTRINNGKIELDDEDRVIYRTTDDKTLPISAAASSIKELAPLYMLLDKYPCSHLSILFEEPEAHLHPQKQVDIADFVINAVNCGSHMQITTHSDYFLRRLNDRIFLFKIKEKNDDLYQQTISRFDYTDLTINSNLIGAYLFHREADGNVKVSSQNLDKGIPYESFYDVIKKEARHSLDIQQVYFNNEKLYVE